MATEQEHTPAAASAEGTVESLSPDTGGAWEVVTGTSRHVWDLDRMTYTRLPGPGGERMVSDGTPRRITSVMAWPKVGAQSYVVFDDPSSPATIEQWRVSATIRRIQRARPHAAHGEQGVLDRNTVLAQEPAPAEVEVFGEDGEPNARGRLRGVGVLNVCDDDDLDLDA